MRARLCNLLGVIGLGILASACEPPAAPRSASQSSQSKADLFGDPGLVPSRDGERARAELALAHDLERALASSSEIEAATVVVSLAPRPPRVVATASVAEGVDEADAEQTARETLDMLAPDAEVLLSTAGPSPGPAQPRALSPALALVLLGLGSSLGVLLERLRQRTVAPLGR